MSPAAAFAAVKRAGAADVVWLGISLLRSPGARAPARAVPSASYGKVFAQGLLVDVPNPKVALFFLALLPPFVDADAPRHALAFPLLGAKLALAERG